MADYWVKVSDYFKNAGMNILYGLIILIVGLIVCKLVKIILKKILKKRKKDGAVITFVVALTDTILKIIVFISSLATMGINTTSIITVLGTCGVAVGLALKESLGNIASGIMIIFNKPFKKGDYIEVAGVDGIIEQINLFNTILNTFDNKRIILPNSMAVNNPVINNDGCELRRVDISIFVRKGVELETIRKIVNHIVDNDERIIEDKPYSVRMSSQDSDSIGLMLRAWTRTKNYWDVQFDLTENIYTELTKEGFTVPNKQVDININQNIQDIQAS